MGGSRHSARQPAFKVEAKLRQTIIETERLFFKGDETTRHLLGDCIRLDYYEDGYPQLPECLDRRGETVRPKLHDNPLAGATN
jgi:hypothetical protein